jgi:hypothetical protein
MLSLATTQEIVDRLQVIAASDSAQIALVDAFRQAIEERILSLTGFLFTDDPYFAPASQTEQQTNVQLGISRFMAKRPIVPMSPLAAQAVKLQARSLASDTLNDILGDLQDKKNGSIMPLASELTPVFPPVGGQAPWFRWRQMIWPVVTFTYIVDPLGSPTNPIPNSLTAATFEWAAFIYAMRPMTGRLKSFSAEKISETYEYYMLKGAVPPTVMMLLGPYIRNRGSLIF